MKFRLVPFLAAILWASAALGQTQVPISGLPAATSPLLAPTTLVPCVQSGVTKGCTVAQTSWFTSGISEPWAPNAYQFFLNTSATPYVLKEYDGASWVTIGTLNGSTHVWTPAGLGTAAFQNTGTSGANVPLLNGANVSSGNNQFTAGVEVGSPTGGMPSAGNLNAQGVFVNNVAVLTASMTPTVSGDCSAAGTLSTYSLTCTKTNGSLFANSATVDATNANNISAGTLGSARLPNPSATTLGGIESIGAVAHNFLTSISTGGAPAQAQPGFTDISGSLGSTQMPALTGDTTASAGTTVTTTGKVNGVTYPASPSANTVPVVTSASAGGTTTYEAVPNAALANSSMTIGGQSTALGGSTTNQGNGSKLQLSTGSTTTNDCVKYDVNGNTVDAGSVCGGGGMVVMPQGRLTVTSATPIITVDAVTQGTLYYDCYVGNGVPYYTGSADLIDTITSCEVSTAMQTSSTGVLNTTSVFDVWWEGNTNHKICVATSGSGGGWASDTGGSNTARGTGYSQLDKTTRPYITNKNAVAHCYNGATDYGSIVANKLTYLGSIYTTAAGKTGIALNPAAASGGSNNIVGVFNAYNRVRASAMSRDTTASWTYSGSFRSANNSTSNRISWVDGLQAISTKSQYQVASDPSTSASIIVGVGLNSTIAACGTVGNTVGDASLAGSEVFPVIGTCTAYPVLGLNFVQALEGTLAATATFYSGTTPFAGITLDLEY